MPPINITERKKRLLIFGGLYAASIILLFFIFSAFGLHLSTGDVNQPVQMPAQLSAGEIEFIQTDSVLHAGLRTLQQSDERLALLGDSASNLQQMEALTQVSSNETALKNAIDSIEILTTASTSAVVMNKMMLNSFRAVLNERQALKNLRAAIASRKTPLSSSQQDVLQWKDQLSQKDNDINRLEMQVKTLQQLNTGEAKTSRATEAQQGEIELLKTAFAEQQKSYEALKDMAARLRTENNLLTVKLGDVKKPAAVPVPASNTSDTRVSELEQKLEAMNADLYFARIDCNLARADAQQIISNARQRKELLVASLGMLNNLAKSGDDGIQKKAKEKIALLNRIATTLHD